LVGHHYIGNTECIVVDPRDKEADSAFSAVIHALAETESVAIVRYVKRKGYAPHLGFLAPHIKAEYECLYYNSLPFAEDLRQYPFASLAPDRARRSFVPSKAQLDAAEDLINSLDLTTAAQDEEG
jgi:ATP-dependent DNA helicase 2 subunit 2